MSNVYTESLFKCLIACPEKRPKCFYSY